MDNWQVSMSAYASECEKSAFTRVFNNFPCDQIHDNDVACKMSISFAK